MAGGLDRSRDACSRGSGIGAFASGQTDLTKRMMSIRCSTLRRRIPKAAWFGNGAYPAIGAGRSEVNWRRTPRSNLATYRGLFDHVRKIFANTPLARRRRYSPGRFSFNVAQGRCPVCEGEGCVMVALVVPAQRLCALLDLAMAAATTRATRQHDLHLRRANLRTTPVRRESADASPAGQGFG